MTAPSHAIEAALESTPTPWGSSRWGELQRCSRAHHLKYHLAVYPAPRPTDAEHWAIDDQGYLATGQVVHSVLHYVQEGVRLADGRPLDAWRDVLRAAAAKGVDPEATLEAERLMAAYWAHYTYDNAGWPEGVEIVGCEVPLEATLGGLPYTSRADVILRVGGRLIVGDHKTRGQAVPGNGGPRSEPDPFKRAKYVRGLRTRAQFLGLAWLVRNELQRERQAESDMMREDKACLPGYAPPVWVNAIVKTKIPAFDRLLVEFTGLELDTWAAMQVHAAAQLQCSSDHMPPINYSACAPEVGSRCRYFEWCHGSNESRALHYRTGAGAPEAKDLFE